MDRTNVAPFCVRVFPPSAGKKWIEQVVPFQEIEIHFSRMLDDLLAIFNVDVDFHAVV
jgi:hypothetical protein